jgi:hypothetical protein
VRRNPKPRLRWLMRAWIPTRQCAGAETVSKAANPKPTAAPNAIPSR